MDLFKDSPGSAAITRISAAFEALPYGVIAASEDGTILFANPVASAIFASAPGELVGRSIAELVPRASQDKHADLVEQFWKNPQNIPVASRRMLVGTRKDGVMVPLEIGLNVMVDGASRYVIASIRDVTDRLNLEARLAAATSEHLGFQRLVGDIAARFGAVDPGELDEIITDSLRQLGEVLQLDRVILWHRPTGIATASPTHFWVSEDEYVPEPFPIASIPYVMSCLGAGEACWFSSVDELPDPIDRETFAKSGLRSGIVIPVAGDEPGSGDLSAVAFSSMKKERDWAPQIIERLRVVAGVMGQAIARARNYADLQRALTEVKQLRDRLATENVELRREMRVLRTPSNVVSESPAIKRVLAQIEQVAPTPATVLLLGETGTGKEVMAQTIHQLSPRHQRQMIRVSCAAIPTALIESELFGRERGAYTGALSRQIGRFEAANQSTLFLDEIGDLPPEVQVKLLRVLQERVIERLGSTQSIKVDVRIITATNQNLEKAVEAKTFREDLYYRLNVFPVVVPPLRERIEDIPGLVWSFVDEFSKLFGKTIESVSAESMRELQRYSWPGNVRELRNVIERAIIIATSPHLVLSPPRALGHQSQSAMTLSAIEVDHIQRVLESTNWRVRGRGGAAERLGIKPTTLESRMARLGITRKQKP